MSDDKVPCPECGHPCSPGAGLAAHRRHKHGVTPAKKKAGVAARRIPGGPAADRAEPGAAPVGDAIARLEAAFDTITEWLRESAREEVVVMVGFANVMEAAREMRLVFIKQRHLYLRAAKAVEKQQANAVPEP